ncbi:MAG: hypothetical protein H7Z41_18985 [Cytophagales bacterium]|nr:hypothetical protein [Armatimonadota bacterium]
MPEKKRKPSISPEAAKILEQYRNAGKPRDADGVVIPTDEASSVPRPTAPPPSPMRRSGTRGK